MSRCAACDEILKDHELVREFLNTGAYADLCDLCYGTVVADLADLSGLDSADYDVLPQDGEVDLDDDPDDEASPF